MGARVWLGLAGFLGAGCAPEPMPLVCRQADGGACTELRGAGWSVADAERACPASVGTLSRGACEPSLRGHCVLVPAPGREVHVHVYDDRFSDDALSLACCSEDPPGVWVPPSGWVLPCPAPWDAGAGEDGS